MCHPIDWQPGNSVDFDITKAYYIECEINNLMLARLSENDAFEIKELLDGKHHSLYGKYINRWVFTDSLNHLICETNKSDGYNMAFFKRNGRIDHLIIGPLIDIPKKMEIKISDSKYYEDEPNPSFIIK
ncbi:MAG: hypothetical protein C4K58_07135 [Flavobacteriaceae bacterium]|nr:MAG: hypothetical protein C4K58_07135 [Flavobacteriaceae bacterium]